VKLDFVARLTHSAMRYAATTATASIAFGSIVSAQVVHINPSPALTDEPVQIRVTGLRPGQPAIIRATRLESTGRSWQSYAGLYADATGSIDLARQPPVNGSFRGLQPMGLLTAMNLGGVQRERARYAFKWSDTLRTEIRVDTGGKEVAAVDTLIQTFARAGIRSTVVRDSGLVATLFTPSSSTATAGIIVLGGSEGGLNSEDLAALLASHGYSALALAYFGVESLPPALDRIPLEYFARAIRYLLAQPGVGRTSVSVVATSKGAEAALALASQYPVVRAIVAFAPSSVVWSCLCSSEHSSWTFDGADLPYVPHGSDPTYVPPEGFPIRPSVNYSYRMRDSTTKERAAIQVERIRGPILLVAGDDDGLWPSFAMARQIIARRQKHRVRYLDVLLHYANAGHLIGKAYLPVGTTLVGGGRLETGGTVEGDALAQADAWPRVLSFLATATAPSKQHR
jgi:dienelactone hydrolase